MVVVVWLGGCALTVVDAVAKLEHGEHTLRAAKSNLHLATLDSARVTSSIRSATDDFGSAHSLLDEPWVAPLDIAPWVGRQLSSARSLAGAAHTVTSAGGAALGRAQVLLRQPHSQPAQRAALLSQMESVVTPLTATVDRIRLGPSDALLPTLASKRATFAGYLTRLQSDLNRGSAALKAVTDLIQGPRTYLVFAANNAEMRAGEGDFLSVGTLSTSHGALTFSSFTPTGQLADPSTPVQTTGDMETLWGNHNPSHDYRDLGFTPQLPANAALASQMWQAQTGQKVDGVLVIDVDALRSILQATGPVSAGGQTIDAATVDHDLLEQQYVGVTDDASDQARQDQLSVLAAAIFGTLQGSGTPITSLASSLVNAAAGRHLMLWSADPTTERAWLASGAGGQISPDGMLLSLINDNGNKLDPYQAITAHMAATRAGGDTRVTVTTTITNTTPGGLSSYAAQGGDPALPFGSYGGDVILDFPRSVLAATVGPAPVTVGGADYGSQVLGVHLNLPPGQSSTVTWTLIFRGRSGHVVIEPSARIPPTAWIGPQGRRFTDATSATVSW